MSASSEPRKTSPAPARVPRRRLPAWLVCGAFLPLAACAREPSVWLAPNLASRDMVEMFARPEAWRDARLRSDVFQFYEAQLGAFERCDDCAGNTFERFAAENAFGKLRAWRIVVAVEAAAVKPWGCSADATLPGILRAIGNVRGAGGRIALVAFDEPLHGGQACGQDVPATAREVASVARGVRLAYPEVQVGDVEPYPHFSVEALSSWLAALAAEGETPAFLHLDVDRVRAAREGQDLSGDVRRLADACASRGIPFGVIFWGGDRLSEPEYAADVLTWVDTFAAARVQPSHVVFQSWSLSDNGRREVPRNLPDDDPAVWTLTRLLLVGSDRLRRLD